MNPEKKKDCVCDFDLVYIELTDIQKKLEESSLNLNDQSRQITVIFNDIRKLLNIKYG